MTRLRRNGIAAAILALSLSPLPALAASSVFNAHLSGKDEVPVKETRASGQVKFTLSSDGTQLEYRLIVANIENVIAAHVYLGSPTENGTIVTSLYGPVAPGGGRKSGILAQGTIVAANLTGTLAGRPLADLIDAMKAGTTYVNVLTDDGAGAPDEKPGDFSSGEIRGQIR
jgi:CHRD domain